MFTDKSSKLEPIIKAGSSNITAWNHHLKDNVLRLGLTRLGIMSSDETLRAAEALDLNDFSPDAESPAGQFIQKKIDEAKRSLQVITEFGSECLQQAFVLLKLSYMSKLSYLSRVTPHHIFLPFAKNIIDGVRECVCTILGHPLSNSHWGQCLLKPRHGELGIINQESLAKGAYLASLLACVPSIESVSTQQQLNLHVLQFDHLDHPGEPNALESVISELCEHITDTHI